MLKRLLVFSLMLVGFFGNASAQEHRRYALIWHDEFNTSTLNTEVWSKIPRIKPDWAMHMSSDERLYGFEDGNLVLRGMVNDYLEKDTAAFLTGGVWCKGKKTFGFGRVEVKAKFDVAQGYWPAIWMLPWTNHTVNWPHGGEIDIMEHFRDNPFVNNTVHSHYTVNLRRRNRPSQVAYPKYNEGEYNTYAVERFHDSLVFFVNGRRTLNYPRFREGRNGQFPFSEYDYYLILDAQLGRDRSPYIDTAKLPVELRIDYVRYYELDTKTDVIPETKDYQQYTKKRYRFRRIVVQEKETFNNPDEYHIVTKRGKATISGNLVWAENTLAQLIGEDGKIANVDFYDRAACAYRGISLDKYEKKLTFDDLNRILNAMAFYKLNFLQWNEKGDCSKEEVDRLKEYASDYGITMVTNIPTIPGVDFIDFEENKRFPAASRIFLQTASKKGGWFYLRGLEAKDLEALMAFSERYWRGGDAGEGTVENDLSDALSPAGSRLANFKEKVAVHRARFPQK
jgi:beta-glucanase (GH16 family)